MSGLTQCLIYKKMVILNRTNHPEKVNHFIFLVLLIFINTDNKLKFVQE